MDQTVPPLPDDAIAAPPLPPDAVPEAVAAPPVPADADVGQAAPAEPVDHASLLQRLYRGSRLQALLSGLSEGAKEGWGPDPLVGIQPGGEAETWLIKNGIFHDPNKAQYGDALRIGTEAITRPVAGLVDMALRAGSAGLNGVIEALDQDQKWAFKDTGVPNGFEIGPNLRIAADYFMTDFPMTTEPMMRAARMPDGRIVDQPIGKPATPEDFSRVANLITPAGDGREITLERTQSKLRSLYEENGIHPAEVLYDAQVDPKLAEHLGSEDPTLPPRYTGVDPKTIKDDQFKADPVDKIPGVSDNLNDALKARTEWPQTPTDVTPPTVSSTWGDHVASIIDRAGYGDLTNALQRQIAPMAMRTASIDARAAAKDFANALRVSRWDWNRLHDALTSEFSREDLQRMYEAQDADSVAMQKGEEPTEVAKLPEAQRAVLDQLQQNNYRAWEDARNAGVLRNEDAKALPGYVPRQVINEYGKPTGGTGLNAFGRNLYTTTSNLRRRSHLTLEETEAAAKEALGEGAQVVRDIRTLPMVTKRLQDATAGRRLINAIRDVGETTADEGQLGTVYEGTSPSDDFFTIPEHPAFYSWRPKIKDGKPVRDTEGNIVFERVPTYVHKSYEGPLRAVMSKDEGLIYRGLMNIKAKATSAIMYSPMLHNAVIYARVTPTKFGNPVATFGLYRKGAALRADTERMREAIGYGLAPIGRGGNAAEWARSLQDPKFAPGQSITAKLLSAVPNFFSKKAGDATKLLVDKAGHFWHDTLLWDRVADVQAGLYNDYLQKGLKRGLDRDSAGRAAAHLANRYAGAIPREAMGENARKLANVLLFSRSFTLGTLGSLKDAITGLPRDVLAQIERDAGYQAMRKSQSFAQRRTWSIALTDFAALYLTGSLLQSTLSVMRGNTTLDDEAQGYIDRAEATMKRMEANPFEALNPFAMSEGYGLTPNSENEQGKQNHVLVGFQSDGTAVYAKNPYGKTPGDWLGWMTAPGATFLNKSSTLLRPAIEAFNNQDWRGKHVFEPNPNTAEAYMRAAANIAEHFAEAQVPEGSISAANELLRGTPTPDERDLDIKQVLGPILGFVFSKGAPGGPASGEYRNDQEHMKYLQETAIPDAIKKAKEGDVAGARETLTAAGVDPKAQKVIIERGINPMLRYNTRAFKRWYGSLSAEDQHGIDIKIQQSQRAREGQ